MCYERYPPSLYGLVYLFRHETGRFLEPAWTQLRKWINNWDENCVFLGYYAAISGDCLPTFWDNLSVSSSVVLTLEDKLIWPLKMEPIGCAETSLRNCRYSLRNNSEERSSHVLCGGSLKSSNICYLAISFWTRSLVGKWLIILSLNAELNPICHLLALLQDHHILHVSRIRVNVEHWWNGNWQWKTEVLIEKPVPVPFHPRHNAFLLIVLGCRNLHKEISGFEVARTSEVTVSSTFLPR